MQERVDRMDAEATELAACAIHRRSLTISTRNGCLTSFVKIDKLCEKGLQKLTKCVKGTWGMVNGRREAAPAVRRERRGSAC